MSNTIIVNENNFINFLDEATANTVNQLMNEGYLKEDIFYYVQTFRPERFDKTYFQEFRKAFRAMSFMNDDSNSVRDILTAYLMLYGLEHAYACSDNYYGEYESEAEFAYEYTTERYDIPSFVIDCIDWDDVYEYQLRRYFTFYCGYIFKKTGT
jgi:hypothetical protein